MIPPQVSPTPKASSSEIPYVSSLGRPLSMASIASSKTAGSTQPPLTDPTTCPSSETAIEVPGPSGPDRSTFTTVARAADFPSLFHCATLSITGFKECLLFYRHQASDYGLQVFADAFILSSTLCGGGDGAGQLLEGLEVVTREEDVDVRERRCHPCRQRFVAWGGLEGVDPDDPVGEATKALHLLGQHGYVSPVPAVGEDHDDGPARHAPLPPAVDELLDRIPKPRSAGDVPYRACRLPERPVRVAGRELACDPGEPRSHGERLQPPPRDDAGVQEAQERAAVRGHRPGDVAEQHDASRLHPRLAETVPHGLPAGPHRAAQRAAGVVASAWSGFQAPALSERPGEPEVCQQALELGELLGRVEGEIFATQHLDRAVAEPDGLFARFVPLYRLLGRHDGAVRLRHGEAYLRAWPWLGAASCLPEQLEGAVVDLYVLGTGGKRDPARPVHVVAAGGIHLLDGAGELYQTVGPDAQAGPPQHPPEGDRRLEHRRGLGTPPTHLSLLPPPRRPAQRGPSWRPAADPPDT